jgi:hypothetical protein
MKLQRSTWILLGVAIALGGGVLIYETYRAQPGEVAEQGSGEPVFAFEESDVQQLTLARQDTTLTFEKDNDGNWLMTKPKQEPAQAAAIAFLLNILTTDPALQTLSATPDQLKDFGLEDPTATVTLTLADESTHTLTVGTPDFSGDSLYVMTPTADTQDAQETSESAAEITVYVVSGGLTNGIERPVDDWLEPPLEESPEASNPGNNSGSTPINSPDDQ